MYTAIYFGAAVLTSAPYKDVAAVELLGLPLAIWAGWTALLGGVLLARFFLMKQSPAEDKAHG
jgi:hypothetical protein